MDGSSWTHCRLFAVIFSSHPAARDRWREAFVEQAGVIADDPAVYPLLWDLAASIGQAHAGTASGHRVLTVSIAGSQGSGKTTLTRLLAWLTETCFGLKTAVISLDDFYLTRHERQLLADSVHPLLATRGVPGTHDIGLLIDVQARLKSGQSALIPQFDKARDDRADGLREQSPADLILCEGWCWSAEPEPESRLIEPVNSLEREQDPDGRWRQYVNQALHTYQDAFDADGSIFLKAPGMETVFDWRWQQEEELRAERSAHSVAGDTAHSVAGDTAHSGIMNETQVREFIAYYERLTRWMLESLPGKVDVCVALAEDHHIRSIHGFR